MYNESQKRQFIAERTRNPKQAKACEQVFEALAPCETIWGADYSTVSPAELRQVLHNIIELPDQSRISSLALIRGYVKWLLDKGVSGVRPDILSIDILGVDRYRAMTVRDPAHLQECLNEVFEPESKRTVSDIYRCYFWLSYIGLREPEIMLVQCDDVDFTSMTISHNGESYPLYKESVPAIANAVTLISFRIDVRNIKNERLISSRSRAPGSTLVRGFTSNPTSSGIRAELSGRLRAAAENTQAMVKLTHEHVQLSGIFYRMYEREMQDLEVDFSKAAERYLVSNRERRDDGYFVLDAGVSTIDEKKKQIAMNYARDYERWKAAWVLL